MLEIQGRNGGSDRGDEYLKRILEVVELLHDRFPLGEVMEGADGDDFDAEVIEKHLSVLRLLVRKSFSSRRKWTSTKALLAPGRTDWSPICNK